MNNTALTILRALDKTPPDPQPSIREIADLLATDSTSVVKTWLDILEGGGFTVSRPNVARSIFLTPQGRDALAHPDQYNVDGPEFTGNRALYQPWEDDLIRRMTVAGKDKSAIAAALNAHPRAEDRGVTRDEASVRYRQGVLAEAQKSA